MKKVIISVISTLLVLAFMVQMGWLQVIGINRFSFEKSDNTQNKLDFECASENNINYSFRTNYSTNRWYIATFCRAFFDNINKYYNIVIKGNWRRNGKRYLLQE